MAVRAEVLQSGFRFDESLGPRGSRYSQGDETDFLIRVASSGHRAWFCREAVVRHIIRPIQLTDRWVLEKAVHFARSEYVLAWRHGFEPDDPRATGVCGTHRSWATHSLRAALTRSGEPVEEAFRARWTRSLSRGRAQAARWVARQKVAAALRREGRGVWCSVC
jgi:hypothetical protein